MRRLAQCTRLDDQLARLSSDCNYEGASVALLSSTISAHLLICTSTDDATATHREIRNLHRALPHAILINKEDGGDVVEAQFSAGRGPRKKSSPTSAPVRLALPRPIFPLIMLFGEHQDQIIYSHGFDQISTTICLHRCPRGI